MVALVVLDVNETLFPLDPVADRLTAVGLEGQLPVWFARVLRDGFAATASGHDVAFRDVARHHLAVLLNERGEEASDDRLDHVLGGFRDVRPYDDVPDGLRRLRDAGITAVTLTNGATGIARAFLEAAGLDDLVAQLHDVQAVGRWKPAPDPYLGVVEEHGVEPGEAALVAVHPWDVHGAKAAGLVGAWLDRRGSRYPPFFLRPDVQAPTLPALVDLLASRRAT